MKFGSLAPLAAALLALALLSPQPILANDLVNPGFEDPITFDGEPFVGYWEGAAGSGTASIANSTASPRTGAQHAVLQITNTDLSFAVVFQDVANLTPGDTPTFSGWYMTPSSPFDVGIEIRIEWRNSGTDTEVSRTSNSTPIPSSTYEQFMLTATVPAGADTARLVFAIQSFGGGATNTGTIYLDDMGFPDDDMVPVEATSWGRLRGLYR